MRYHNITKDDMLNGEGLRVVLWLAGCEHHCKGCQNPITWDPNGGLIFDYAAEDEIFEELKKDYIDGITFSGGDPLHPENVFDVSILVGDINKLYPNKTIWLYTGYTWEEIIDREIDILTCDYDALRFTVVANIDVLVDGKYIEELRDISYPWAGSTNQRVIDVQKSLETGTVVLYDGTSKSFDYSVYGKQQSCSCDS